MPSPILDPATPMSIPEKLPDSTLEVKSLVIVALIAGIAAFARVLYGRDEIRWRITLASVMVAMFVGMGVYSVAASYMAISGYLGVAIGVSCGLFMDDILKRAREVVATTKLPGPFGRGGDNGKGDPKP